MFKHILLPTDDSELSRKAVCAAIEFARATGAQVTGFYVAQEYVPIMATEGFGYLDPESIEIFEKNIQTHAENCLAFVAGKANEAGVQCRTYHVTGNNIHEAIIAAARDSGCDLIWMASHGRKGLSAVLLGSETTKVLTHSNVPVLVYK